ncbi:EscU/YscU/HrcU family type III secretion system export apparatus switch protein [Croceicoccus mobilis]|uniref:Flagellar biosynthesis protein FlhB n=1 Tax=Croceicoccus mobilis TaxID=1703339 RepID=A0A916YWD0_9SPHN|nr:EscU/YscU/HrcU family type III secretion system export apparatus switch protein [Croceicoccus mobilis]GGD64207.1 flagellar biosynthesis protein FlhB [Croceicoccus mobilis]
MSAQSDSGEKTLAPTDKRKQDAAKNGDVLRSKELATASAILLGAGWMALGGGWVWDRLTGAMRHGLMWDRADLDAFTPERVLLPMLGAALPPVLVLGALMMAGALISQLGFGTGVWVGGNLAFKGSRINPLSGLKRMFGMNGLIEMGKGLAKVALLAAIAWVWGKDRIMGFAALGRGNMGQQLGYGWDAIVTLLFALGAGLLLIALVDVPIQMFRRNKRLMMSHQDMRDEHKQSEGSPENKAAIRDRQRRMAAGALVPAMKEAQFVITNPSHFAVALVYDPDRAHAPILLAKGRDDKALAMRELAAEYEVPVLEYPPLARALYFTTQERQVIRHELYAAVAAVLGFVLSLKRGESPVAPSVNLPVTMHFDADGRAEIKPE